MTFKAGSILKEKYELTEVLGEGGFGIVYRAKDIALNRTVALKILKLPNKLSEEDLKRFIREAAILAKLNHENIIKVFSVDQLDDGNPFVVMEFLQGKTLRELLYERGQIDEELCEQIFAGICNGLAHAHQNGVIHRDLSPQNVFLVEETNKLIPKLIDFGLARIEKNAGGRTTALTVEGAVLGNPQFMSPESCLGKRADAASDIYSLGLVLYNMLTGHAPYDDCSAAVAYMYKHMNEYPPEPILEWKDKRKATLLKSICWNCIQKDPLKRPPSAKELLRDLNSNNTAIEFQWDAESSKGKPQICSKKTILLIAAPLILIFVSAGVAVKLFLGSSKNKVALKDDGVKKSASGKLNAIKRRMHQKLKLFGPESPELVASYFEMADYYYNLPSNDSSQECLNYLNKVESICKRFPDRHISFSTDIWDVYRMQGVCLAELHRYAQAEELAKRVLQTRSAFGSKTEDIDIYWLRQLASFYDAQGKLSLAEKTIEDSLKLSSSSAALTQAETNFEASRFYVKHSQQARGMQCLKNAFKIAEREHFTSIDAPSTRCYYNILAELADQYRITGKTAEAENLAQIGLKQCALTPWELRLLVILSDAQWQERKIEESKSSALAARDKLEQLTRTQKSENPVHPYSYYGVATGLWRIGEYKSAIPLLKKADELCKNIPIANSKVFALEDDLAWCYFNCQMWSNAEQLYRKLLNMQVPDLDHQRYISVNDRLAECCKQLGKKDEAISFARKAVELSDKEKPAAIPDSYLILAENSEKLGQTEQAKVYIERAINNGNQTGSALVATRIALAAARFYSKEGNEKRAHDVLRNALDFVELLKGDKTQLQNALSRTAKS